MSQGWLETRIGGCERTCEMLLRLVQDLTQQIKAAANSARTANQQYQTPSGSSGGGCFYCYPNSIIAAAVLGTWPGITPTGFTISVYQASGTGVTLVAASGQCYNFMPSALVANRITFLQPDGAGNYNVVTQSCN